MEPVSLCVKRSLTILPVLKVVNSDILIPRLKLPSPKAALSGSSESGLPQLRCLSHHCCVRPGHELLFLP